MVKNKSLKIYAASGGEKWISSDITPCYSIENADVVVLPGGSDWNPAIYDEIPNSTTRFYREIDSRQLQIIIEALKHGKFLLGICRGLQALHITAGGKLIQHVTGHMGDHTIVDKFTKDIIHVNSMHHQMVDLSTISSKDYSLIAYSEKKLSMSYETSNGVYVDVDVEPEVVRYWGINALGYQYHPESLSKGLGLSYSIQTFKEAYETAQNYYMQNDGVIDEIIKRLKPFTEFKKGVTSNVMPLPFPKALPEKTLDYEPKKNWLSNIKEF